jgi:hypothetical protein
MRRTTYMILKVGSPTFLVFFLMRCTSYCDTLCM